MSECDISKCIVCKNFDSQSKEIKRLKKELKVTELRGRVEELKKILTDAGDGQILNYIEKRLKELQGVEK